MTEKQEEYKMLIKSANAGADMETFRRSNAGQILHQKAVEDEMEALRKLAVVDPADPVTIRALQLEAAVPRLTIRWIEEVIRQGEVARFSIEETKTTY